MSMPDADVVVVGGGPAGAATAILLCRQGFAVTLLEKARFPRPKPCGESLSPEAIPMLAKLGVLDAARRLEHGRIAGFQIFPHAGAPFRGTYAARSAGVAHRAAGIGLPRLHLDTLLLDAARSAGATVREGCAVRQVGAWDGDGRQLRGRTASGEPFAIRTRLVIGADGVHSTVARQLGLARQSRRLRQVAVVTHMRGVGGIGAFGEMHVAPTGYCGVAPLGSGLANVAIVLPASTAAARMRAAGGIEALLWSHLTTHPHLTGRLSHATIVAGPWTTSGLAWHVRHRIDDGLILVGDAGGYYDPFTGEGIYRGLRSAELAVGVAGPALRRRDLRAARLAPYADLYRRQFLPKRLVEIIVHEVTTRPALFERVAARLRQQPRMADALMGVTGDFLSPYEVLSPRYLARLFL